MPRRWPARFAVARIFGIALAGVFLGGCSMFGRGDPEPQTTATTSVASTAPAKDEEIDVRRYLGPKYCPELRVVSGAELVRRYEKGREDDPDYVIWQASVGKTARECLFDLQGGLTLKIGVSGRVIAGPKGGADSVSVPLKIAVVKFKEAVLATETQAVDVAIPATGSTTFTQVKEILVPSPGQDRDYLIFVGFDVGEWDPLTGELAPVEVVEQVPPPVAPPAPPPTTPPTPSVLPTPDDGFVLSQ